MSSERISSTAVQPSGGQPGALVRVWTSSIYPRYTLSPDEIQKIINHFVGTPESPGPLTVDEARYEIRESELWLDAHPTIAARRRAWYTYLRRWLSVAAEKKVYRNSRRNTQGPRSRYYEGGGADDERRRALGLD